MGSGGDGDRGPQPRKLRRGARDMCAHGPHSGAGPRRPCPSTNHLHFPRSYGIRHERLSPCHCSYTRVAALLLCTDWFHIMIARAQAPQDRHEHLISPLTTPLRYPMRLCKHGASRGVCWSTTSLPQVGLQLTFVVHRVVWSILSRRDHGTLFSSLCVSCQCPPRPRSLHPGTKAASLTHCDGVCGEKSSYFTVGSVV